VAFTKSKRSEYRSYEDFQAAIGQVKANPIYLFIGKEDFLIDECVAIIVNTLVPPEMRGFNLDVMYGSKVEAKDVLAHATSFPMMGDRRVVIVKEFEKLVLGETAKETVTAYVRRPLESTCLVLISVEPDFRKRPFTDLKKSARVYSCQPLYDNQVPGWISRRVEAKGKKASIDTCRMLQAYVGNSLRSLDNEIEKLFIYVADRKEISTEDIAAVVGATKGYTVFDLQNCIGRRDMKEALTVLARMMEAGESPQLIIIMLTRFFNTLLRISELRHRRTPEHQLSGDLGISPFFLKQYVEFHANFTPAHVENSFHALLSADAALKTSSGDPRLVMDLLVYALVKNTSESLRVNGE